MNIKQVKQVLESLDNNKYEVKVITEQGKTNITIINKFQKCDVCKSTKHYRTLSVRQDSRVKFFMVGKKVCRTCLPQVQLILDNLKDSVQSPLKTGRW
tara:strand:+ start:327 stop:620 length:294 start_codon:yes stop_codon:yes gene_type:complete